MSAIAGETNGRMTDFTKERIIQKRILELGAGGYFFSYPVGENGSGGLRYCCVNVWGSIHDNTGLYTDIGDSFPTPISSGQAPGGFLFYIQGMTLVGYVLTGKTDEGLRFIPVYE